MVVQRDGSQHGYIDPVFVAIFNHGGQFGVQGMDAFYHQEDVYKRQDMVLLQRSSETGREARR